MTPSEKRTVQFVSIAFVIVLFWFFWADRIPGIVRWAIWDDDIQRAALWGDSFGGFNALMSALGFAAVLSTLIVQNRSLRDQQIDQHLQRFEATFFELLKLMRELRQSLEYRNSAKLKALQESRGTYVRRGGLDAITQALSEVRYWLITDRSASTKYTDEEIESVYLQFVHRRYESRFAPYFRIIYTILHKIMKDDILSEKQKAYYGNLLRSQLTSHEISLLAINGVCKVSKDLRSHIIFFRFLKYLPEGRVRRMLSDVYPPEAFAARD